MGVFCVNGFRSLDDVCELSAHQVAEGLGGQDDLLADLPSRDGDDIVLGGAFVEGGEKGLLHAHGRTAAPNVAGEGEQFGHMEHGNVLLAHCFGGLFKSNSAATGMSNT